MAQGDDTPDRDHADQHQHGSELSEMQLRVRALETVLAEKGYIDPAAIDAIIEASETKVETYYHHWLAALERIVAANGLADAPTLARTRQAWRHACARTPHGTPIELRPSDFKN